MKLDVEAWRAAAEYRVGAAAHLLQLARAAADYLANGPSVLVPKPAPMLAAANVGAASSVAASRESSR